MPGKSARFGGQSYRDDQVARLEHAVALRCVAGQAVKRLDRDLTLAALALDLGNRVECNQRHAEIRRMRRDTALAPAQHRVQAVLASAGIAAGAWIALVAGAGDVVKVRTARPL